MSKIKQRFSMVKEKLSDQVVEFVLSCHDNVLRKLTVSSLAGRFLVDRSHLAREFKAGKKFTLSKFIQGEKMARAAIILRDSDSLTIEKLSIRLGYCSVEYFREVFKRYFAVVPSEYRKYKHNQKENQSAL